jgi:tellurite resistance protein
MGLLSRLTGKVMPQKKAADDVLLLHTMMLMSGADGVFDMEEKAGLNAYFEQLPEFKGKDFAALFEDAVKVVRRYPNLKDSVKAIAELSTTALKTKAFLIAADIALSSGEIDEAEDQMLEAMQRTLAVDDATASKIIDVLSIKYAT